MFNIFRYIGYAFQTKKGLEKPDELVSEISFGFIQVYFIISFIGLGIIALILGFLGLKFNSSIVQVFAVLCLLALSLDIFVYIRVKRFFDTLSKRVVDVSKSVYKNTTSNIRHTIDTRQK